jgi:hypothetical protein
MVLFNIPTRIEEMIMEETRNLILIEINLRVNQFQLIQTRKCSYCSKYLFI